MSVEDDNVNLRLADIERSEKEIIELYREPVSATGPVGYQHFYLFGIARRALAQSHAFRQTVDSKNSLVAASLLRLQLDTTLRLYALFWVKDPDDFAKQVFLGKPINKMKAADGAFMNDRYLRDRLAPRNKWVASVYKEASGFIHFSHRHIKAALHMKDAATGNAEIRIGHCDLDKPVEYYGELIRAFLHINLMIKVAAEDWFSRIKNSETSASVGEIPSSRAGAGDDAS